jgi:hypothetical protein
MAPLMSDIPPMTAVDHSNEVTRRRRSAMNWGYLQAANLHPGRRPAAIQEESPAWVRCGQWHFPTEQIQVGCKNARPGERE